MPHSKLYAKLLAEANAQPHPLGRLPSRVPDPVSSLVYSHLPLHERTPAQIARTIRANWRRPYFGAVPYIDALAEHYTWGDVHGPAGESLKSIVCYFRANAGSWRGPVARAVKAELLRRFPVR